MVGIHGAYVSGDGYPQVGRHGEGSGGEQMDVLGHARVGGFGSDALSPVVTGGDAGLCRQIVLALCVEQRGSYTEVQAEPVGSFPVVFSVERQFHAPLRKVAAGGIGGVLPGRSIVYVADV